MISWQQTMKMARKPLHQHIQVSSAQKTGNPMRTNWPKSSSVSRWMFIFSSRAFLHFATLLFSCGDVFSFTIAFSLAAQPVDTSGSIPQSREKCLSQLTWLWSSAQEWCSSTLSTRYPKRWAGSKSSRATMTSPLPSTTIKNELANNVHWSNRIFSADCFCNVYLWKFFDFDFDF